MTRPHLPDAALALTAVLTFVTGAVLLRLHLAVPMGLAAALTTGVAVAGHRLLR